MVMMDGMTETGGMTTVGTITATEDITEIVTYYAFHNEFILPWTYVSTTILVFLLTQEYNICWESNANKRFLLDD